MSNSTRTTLSPFRLSLLALAIAAVAGACSQDKQADAQVDAHADATSAATASDHDAADQHMHGDASDEHAADEHADHAAVALPTPPTTLWASDAPLREGMRRMHQAVGALEHAEHNHLDAAQATAAAQQVQDAANFMFTNCKLTPEPDAALHGVLAALISGAAAIKADPADTSPVASMREAVDLYPHMFEDATWKADTAPAK